MDERGTEGGSVTHTKEPWSLGEEDRHGDTPINAADWRSLALVVTHMHGGEDQCPEGLANARRIVACVNACAGIPTDTLELVPSFERAGIKTIREIEQQRDELLSALKDVMLWINNWTPDFTYDPDWPIDRDRADSAIAKSEAA